MHGRLRQLKMKRLFALQTAPTKTFSRKAVSASVTKTKYMQATVFCPGVNANTWTFLAYSVIWGSMQSIPSKMKMAKPPVGNQCFCPGDQDGNSVQCG